MPTPTLAARITRPSLALTDRAFHYTNSASTDVASTFAAERQRLQVRAAQEAAHAAATATAGRAPRRMRRVRAGDMAAAPSLFDTPEA